ncbi:DUF836-domain-containing protein [Neolentinus lepideus HHB14362 ss-1]|uniref:DUF836-domain-containing protein n=1 Tax=Neolentinus lepideus HHB14362 ss-1 TaxID=1314782 RepID=A0A165TFQ9_9AGAM|nr:DUF836-domain-containing protein [Neolentinus lepideus HHB14362 ss-1]
MASSIGRVARLTLFSGPNCSLCDIAKAELSKVRATRPFHLDIVNIQDKGQEKWKKKYVYWIPALHLDGKEIAKGRWDGQTVTQALDKWEQETKTQGSFKDPQWSSGLVQDSSRVWADGGCYYERYTDDVLGAADDVHTEVFQDDGRSRCFNCGSPGHNVSACPLPLDRQLIALSRQLRNFYHEQDSGQGEGQRFHVVEEWKNRRLRWLDEFEPGEVRSTILREALGLGEHDAGEHAPWLKNMAVWGYPKGWVGESDPREKVALRILDIKQGDEYNEAPFFIFGDNDEEQVDSKRLPDSIMPLALEDDTSQAEDDEGSDNSPTSEDDASCASGAYVAPSRGVDGNHGAGIPVMDETNAVQRWAKCPPTYFSAELLPVYSGVALPPLSPFGGVSEPEESTFTIDRDSLWRQILSLPGAPQPPLPPDSPPPPPPGSPPPLPDGPAGWLQSNADDEDEDMDLSD